jgi:two-component system response regulator PilR (NtrC family)
VVLLCDSDVIDIENLPEEIKSMPGKAKVALPESGMDIEKLMEDTEKAYLLKALEKTNGVKTEAAKLLKITFRSLRHKLKKYGIDKKIITD